MTDIQVKKVLEKGKPFFSFGVVLNFLPNSQSFHRFAIVIGSKSVHGSVERNYFRRNFYHRVSDYIEKPLKNNFFDLVFVVKKSTLLEQKNEKSVGDFFKDIDFLLKKMFN